MNRIPLDDEQFDLALRESLPGPPPEEIVHGVTPWRGAMGKVLTGLALSSVTLNFLCLNYILPAIGLLLMLLGFRALRRENGWFKSCFVVCVIKALYFFPSLVLNATIYQSAVNGLSVNVFITALNLALTLVQFFCLWRGFKAVKAKAGLPAEAGAAGALIVWFVLITVLAIFGLGGTVSVVGMLIAYILILRGLFRLSSELDEAGYAVESAPVRVSDSALARIILIALALGVACGYLFGGSYKMDWTPVENSETAEIAEIKAQLTELGFPEDVLADLTDEEIRGCKGALQVVSDVREHPANKGRQVVEHDGYTEYHTVVYDVKELRITGVAVELPGERESWRIFHHFRWVVDPGFQGTESIQLWPASHGNSLGWVTEGDLTGRVLYTLDGRDYTAPYRFLGVKTFTANSIFWGQQTSSDPFAEFSLPGKGEAKRGYVAYTASACFVDVECLLSSWINYTHQTSWLQYPVKTAAENRMSGSWNLDDTFLLIQDALQFYSTDGEARLIG